MLFQSTRPIRGATESRQSAALIQSISIHAPHTGRDVVAWRNTGEFAAFQSTRPIRGATNKALFKSCDFNISIHAPHTGRDWYSAAGCGSAKVNFNPRAPYGARHPINSNVAGIPNISIHAPHTGRDTMAQLMDCVAVYFNPRAPYGARQQKCIIYVLHFCNNRQSKHKNQQETSSVRTFF